MMRVFLAVAVFSFVGLGFGCIASAQNVYEAAWSQPSALRLWQEETGSREGSLLKEHFGTTESGDENPFDEPIETDRHDFTQSTSVVGRGVIQLEYGVFYSTRAEGTERETSYATPELQLRYGLTENMEFRTRFDYGWKYNEGDDDIEGGEDIIFALKVRLSEQSGRRPDSAVELRLSAPTGSEDLSTGRWEPGVDFIYGWEFGENYTFTASTGGNGNALGDISFINFDTDPKDHFIAWTQSMALGKKLTKKTTGYFEWYGIFTYGRDDDDALSFLNIGIDYLINNNMLIDFRVGGGLTAASDDLFAGIGGAFRF